MLAPTHTVLTTERRPLAALADIVAPWRELAARAAEPNVFYEPDFAPLIEHLRKACSKVHRFVETQALTVRPLQYSALLARHLLGVN